MPSDKQLIQAITADLRDAWSKFQEKHPDETIYGFGLYTTDGGDYFIPFVLGEKGYEEIAEDGDEDGFLRWNVADSPYHEDEDCICYTRTDEAIAELPSPFSFEDDDESDAALQVFFDSAFEALQSLDKEKLFGTGKARDSITLLLTAGDIDEDFVLNYAKKLNPAKVFETFKAQYEG
jgi:hypothetical protein